jgi:hypothetical protein
VQLEAQVFGHLDHDALGERAAMVADSVEHLLGGPFDLWVIVAALPHLRAQFRIGTARFLWRGRMLIGSA